MIHLINNYYCIFLPEDAISPWISKCINNGHEYFEINWFTSFGGDNKMWPESKPLPPGTYQFLFLSKDVTEEEAKGVVESYIDVHDNGHTWDEWFKDYTDVQQVVGSDYSLSTALESFHSLLTSKSLTGNYAILKLKK